MTDIIDRLKDLQTVHPEDEEDGALYDAARVEIIRLRERCDAQARILQHAYPERSGRYFISGQGGEVDNNGLPETVSICPAFGCDWTVTYRRVD